MAQKNKKKKIIVKKGKRKLPFSKKNYQIFFIGLVALVFGYIFLSIGPEDSFFTRTLGPVILFLAYCVVIPLSILYREKPKTKAREE